jgi:hypothetical protein
MKSGKTPRSGDVVITRVQFTDSAEIKMRPAVVLFEEMGNVVDVTSNLRMKGSSFKERGRDKRKCHKIELHLHNIRSHDLEG